MNRVAIIPARGGSRRIPRKNVRLFHGKPLIAYSIEVAKNAFCFDRVWVSTEDPEVASVADLYGAFVLYRPRALAEDHVGTQEVMRHALQAFGGVEIACCIYPTAPMLQPRTLHEALVALTNSNHDYVVPLAAWLRDPGQFYMGRAEAFIKGRSLAGMRTGFMQIDPATECDINTEEDFQRAEQMYTALHGVPA